MSFHELPTELLWLVGEFCEPRDVYSLALSCRESHSKLVRSLSKHQKVWRYWNTIDSNNPKKPMHNLVLKLARKPYLAVYVETLKCEFDYQEPGAYSEFEVRELMESLEAVASEQRLLLNEFPARDWRSSYQIGFQYLHMDTLSGCLIRMLPKLRRLECFGSTVGDDDILEMLVSISRATKMTSLLPLQHLKSIEVKLDRNISEGGLPADWLVACMSLPCLESFAACRMDGSLSFFNHEDIPSSNITRLVLQMSTLVPDLLIQILSRLTNLQSFAYEHGECALLDAGAFAAKRIATALVKYAGHSLKHLTMHGQDDDELMRMGCDLPYVTLEGFNCLKTLRCSTYLLTSDPRFPRPDDPLAPGLEFRTSDPIEYSAALATYESDDFLQPTPGAFRRLTFATRLPQSLKSLHLESYPYHTPLPYHALNQFVRKANDLLPKLRQLYLEDWSTDYLERKGLLGLIEENGLAYKRLPNPFRVGSGSPESESESEESGDEEEEP